MSEITPDQASDRHPAWNIYDLDHLPRAVVIATELPREEWPFNGRNWFIVNEDNHWDYLNELNEKNPGVKFKYEYIETSVLAAIVEKMERVAIKEVEAEGWTAHGLS